MKRKLSCILLAFVMMLAAVPLLGITAFAEDSVNLLTKVEKSNGQVIVTVSTDGELNVDAISFEMAFDESVFKLLKPKEPCTCTCEYVFGEEMESEPYRESPYYCSWVNLETVKDNNGNSILENGRYIMEPYKGELFKFVFDIKNDAKADKTYSFTPKNTQCATIEISDETEKPVVTDKDIAVNIDEKPIDVELKEEDIPRGVTVSGTSVSWNSTDDAVYLLYDSDTADKIIQNEWKYGLYSDSANVKYTCKNADKGTITDTKVDGKDMKEQSFSFDGVEAGGYKLVIFKPNKYAPKIVPFTAGSSAVELGQQKLWLYGDVNYNGVVDDSDATQIIRYAALKASIFNNGDENIKQERILCADVNANGVVDDSDATQIVRYAALKSSIFNTLV